MASWASTRTFISIMGIIKLKHYLLRLGVPYGIKKYDVACSSYSSTSLSSSLPTTSLSLSTVNTLSHLDQLFTFLPDPLDCSIMSKVGRSCLLSLLYLCTWQTHNCKRHAPLHPWHTLSPMGGYGDEWAGPTDVPLCNVPLGFTGALLFSSNEIHMNTLDVQSP